jgi:SpoIID/LytB domain protein
MWTAVTQASSSACVVSALTSLADRGVTEVLGGRRRRWHITGLAGAVIIATASPAVAVDLGVFSGPVQFDAPDGVTLEVDDRRYVGVLESRVAGGGLTLLNELSFDAYLEGLAEVPVSWPDAALQAQVIAARSYAWRALRRAPYAAAGYDICATQACQVFAGRDIAEADPAGRWARAVAATSGLVLVGDDGEPILARYSSSTGGTTQANVEIFPDDGDFPYLQSVDDPHDDVSPFHRWQVTFPRADMNAIFARGESLSVVVPYADVTMIARAFGEDLVRVTGQNGQVVDVTASDFRFFVAREAPRLDPARYPSARADGSGRLPATLLSSLMVFTTTTDGVTVDGRGFGHAVGMGQYGALGKAQAGFTAAQILEAYYGGITPTIAPTLPETVRVGLRDDVSQLSVTPRAPVTVRVGDTVLTDRALGTWQVIAGPDRTLRLAAPAGYGAPLVVDATTSTRPMQWAAEVVTLETVVNKHVELEVVVTDAAGAVVATQPAGIVGPGRHTLDVTLDGPGAAPIAPGSYGVAVVAIDETGDRAGTPAAVVVRAPSVAVASSALTTSSPNTPATRPDPVRLAIVTLLAALVGAALALLLAHRAGGSL